MAKSGIGALYVRFRHAAIMSGVYAEVGRIAARLSARTTRSVGRAAAFV